MKLLKTTIFLLLLIIGCSKQKPQAEKKNTDISTQPEVTEIQKDTTAIEDVETVEEKELEVETVVLAENKLTEQELWKAYQQAREEVETAKTEKKWKDLREQLLLAAEYAELLKRPDIAAWQYNNIGYYAIEEFKIVTDYFTLLDQLNALEFGKEKQEKYKAISSIFLKNFYILNNAEIYLNKSKEIDNSLTDEGRTKRINNNLLFIKEIKKITGYTNES